MVTATFSCPPTSELTKYFFHEKWVQYFGSPRAVLTDRGSQFISREFNEYVTQDLRIPIINTSPYYPQGNAINEASHQFLQHALKTSHAIAFRIPFQEVVSAATLVYNATPHSILGTTPYNLVFGQDLVIPGWSEFTPVIGEPTRQLTRLERFYRSLGKHILETLNTNALPPDDVFKVGDIITYKLSSPESSHIPHLSGTAKWNPQWSLPYRVMKVKTGQLVVQPLWTRGRSRSVPFTQCKLLNPCIPRSLRDLMPYVLQIPLSSSTKPHLSTDDMNALVPLSQAPPQPSLDPLPLRNLKRLHEIPPPPPDYKRFKDRGGGD